MTTVAIVNVTSYTAMELLRLLSQHPQFIVTSVTARSAVGQRLGEVFPSLYAVTNVQGTTRSTIDPFLVIEEEPAETDLAFVCLPHAAATERVAGLLQRGTKVIDLSADFRLHNVHVYEEWYKHTHPEPLLLEKAVYGLCERYRKEIQDAVLVANPGCNATAAILALLPAVIADIITSDLIIDVKAALSGAGRSLSLHTHYAEANEDVHPYSITGHRHLPEVLQELEKAAKVGGKVVQDSLRVTFIPHLIPMTRGILATCYANLKRDSVFSSSDVYRLYEEYYADEPFVHVVDRAPHTKWTYGSNHCFIHPMVDTRTHRLVVMSCLDNMGKGAAGQAIQNANILYGLPEVFGLSNIGITP